MELHRSIGCFNLSMDIKPQYRILQATSPILTRNFNFIFKQKMRTQKELDGTFFFQNSERMKKHSTLFTKNLKTIENNTKGRFLRVDKGVTDAA